MDLWLRWRRWNGMGIGNPCSRGGAGSRQQSTNSFGTNLNSRYEINANVWLRSPVLDLSTASDATLVYSQFVDIEEGFDSWNSVRAR